MGVSDYVRQGTTFTAHATEASHFYDGSRILQPIADFTGLPIDQVNFNASLFASALLAFLFRLILGRTGTICRHLIELTAGIGLLYFCFGSHIVYVFGQSTICYLIMRFAPTRYEHIAVFIFCFAYLSATHIIRQILDYGGYTLDVTLPLMMLTQRLTSMAFSLHDGFTSAIESLPQDQKFLAVGRFPTLLEFYSYAFYFQGVMCGPVVHYADYLSFVEGRNWTRFSMPTASAIEKASDSATSSVELIGNKARPATEAAPVRIQVLHPLENGDNDDKKASVMPLSHQQLFKSSIACGLKALGIGVICGFLMMGFTPFFPISKLTDPEFHANNSFWYKSLFMLAFVFFAKQRYFFVWKFSDGVHILSGLSYSGITKQGKALWRLTDNIDIREFEIGNRFAIHINAWNKTTATWLRFMIYDRAPWHPTLLTFFISALWHGFYPGYYIAFLTAALFLQAVRSVRSIIRPICELHVVPRFVYDTVAFVLVRCGSAYMGLPYFLMTLAATYQVYSSLYFWPHLLAFAAIFILPHLERFLPESMRQKRIYGRARLKKLDPNYSGSESNNANNNNANNNNNAGVQVNSGGSDSGSNGSNSGADDSGSDGDAKKQKSE